MVYSLLWTKRKQQWNVISFLVCTEVINTIILLKFLHPGGSLAEDDIIRNNDRSPVTTVARMHRQHKQYGCYASDKHLQHLTDHRYHDLEGTVQSY